MNCRRVEYLNNLVITTDEPIMVIDNGCDQSIINTNSFLVKSFAGVIFEVGGALNAMQPSRLELVNEAYTLATLPDNSKVIFLLNQCFLDRDSSQNEALLQPHQARSFGVRIDDCASCHLRADGEPGTQSIAIGDNTYPMHFDGWKCYFRISKPSEADLLHYPIVELTSPCRYEPQSRSVSRRITANADVTVDDWRRRLGYPTLSVTEATMENCTNMIQTLDAETRGYMRDHHQSRVYALRPRRINDDCYSDTFFSTVTSVRRFKCFQMFAFKRSA